MKRRSVAILLLTAVLLSVLVLPQRVSAVNSVSKTDDEIITATMEYLNIKEGNCNSVNANDNGAVSIGMIQWHGTRALNILKQIVALIPDYALETLGEAMYNEILTAKNWETRILTSDEKAAMVIFLSTDESHQVQVAQARSDLGGYLTHAKKMGLLTPALQFYFMDIENQYGSGGAELMLHYAKQASQKSSFANVTEFHNGMRRAAYQLEYNNSVTPYMPRRESTYTYLVDKLKWETDVPYSVMTIPNGTDGSGHISLTVNAGGTFTFPQNPYTKDGYDFIGWQLHRLPSDTWYVDGIGWCTSGWIQKQHYTICVYKPGQTQTADSKFLSSGSTGALYQLVPVWLLKDNIVTPPTPPTPPAPIEGLPTTSNGCTHNWVKGASQTATCTAGAYTEYSCSACGLEERVDTAIANGHTYGAWTVSKEAGCESSGLRSRKCSVCGLTQTETVSPTGHQAGSAQQLSAPTCTTEGKQITTCKVCGKVLDTQTLAATGHTRGETVVDRKPTCTADGMEHACCAVCGTVIYSAILPAQHSFGEWVQYTPATAQGDGVQVRTCTVCNYTEMQKLAGGNHVHTYKKTTVAATCTTEGCDLYTCDCGDSYRENVTSATGHSAIEVTTAATCVSDGFKVCTCTACHAVWLEAGNTALGHSWNSGKITKAATADTDGTKLYTCTRCGAEKTETLPATGTCSGGGSCPGHGFTDMPNNWAHAGLDFCIEHGLLAGTSAKKISPDMKMTRAMLVAVLYRLDGSPSVSGKSTFTDLTAAWYHDAVNWASSQGIVSGTGNNHFSPDATVTREQLTTILYRYVIYKDCDFSASADLSTYPDGVKTSIYARAGMKWAVGAGMLSGSLVNGTAYLQPQGNATRAQVASILMRFVQKFAEQ